MRKIILFFVVLAVVGCFPLSVQGKDSKKEFWDIINVREGDKGDFALIARSEENSICRVAVIYKYEAKRIFLEYFKIKELKELAGKKIFNDPNANRAITIITELGEKCLRENRKGTAI